MMTQKQRDRKLEAARIRLVAAQELLGSVASDMAAEAFLLTPDERQQWARTVHTLTSLDRTLERFSED